MLCVNNEFIKAYVSGFDNNNILYYEESKSETPITQSVPWTGKTIISQYIITILLPIWKKMKERFENANNANGLHTRAVSKSKFLPFQGALN